MNKNFFSSRWGNTLWIFFCGAVSALGAPPLYFFPLFWLALIPLLNRLFVAQGFRAGYRLTAIFFFGRAFAGMSWIIPAPSYDLGLAGWFVGFVAVLFLTILYVVFYFGVVGGITTRFFNGPYNRAIAFAVLWGGAEWLRGHFIFNGFPWNLPAYDLNFALPLISLNALLGPYGLSLAYILFSVILMLFFIHRQLRHFLLALGILTIAIGAGLVRLYEARQEMAVAENSELVKSYATVRIIQPNISMSEKWQAETKIKHFANMAKMAFDPSGGVDAETKVVNAPNLGAPTMGTEPRLVILPEAAIEFTEPAALVYAKFMEWGVQQNQSPPAQPIQLIAGKLEWLGEPGQSGYLNALQWVNASGVVQTQYGKSHLVPLGEYIPFKKIFRFKNLTAAGLPDTTPGDGLHTITGHDGVPDFLPVICFEIIFPHEMLVAPRPHAIVQITNDAWYDGTLAPWQHKEIARAAAVYMGVPVLRAANNGISTIIDATGAEIASLAYNQKGVINGRIPARVLPTIYYRLGDLIFGGLLIIIGGAGFLLHRPLRQISEVKKDAPSSPPTEISVE